MQELYDLACETNAMMAPINSPREIYNSKQLDARGFFGPVGEVERFPRTFCVIRSADGEAALAGPQPFGGFRGSRHPKPSKRSGEKAWEGTRILEFGSGAAGPIATRYFAEHGAIVLRIESKSRADFLRTMALLPDNPHGLEGAPMYIGLNV